MNNAFDEYRLEDIASDHLIGAGVFLPFVIARLQGESRVTEAVLTVTLRNIEEPKERQSQIRLSWSAESVPTQPLGVSERTITEWAAYGLACVILASYTQARIYQVTSDGDRFDYWVRDGKREYGLEVSGTLAEEIEARHQAKVRQLRENPYGVGGYVIVAGFARLAVICSFHQYEENVR